MLRQRTATTGKNASNDALRGSKRPRRFLSSDQSQILRRAPPVYLSALEGAAYTNFSERNFRKLVAQGVFPRIRIGRRLVFRREALDAALAGFESKSH